MPEACLRVVESNQRLDITTLPRGWETMTPAEARGLVWMFEPPVFNAQYIIGVDPAQGITGWDRTVTQDDQDWDNSAIQVFRSGLREATIKDQETGKDRVIQERVDYQVAEYAAPVDYEATAAIVNALGRLYSGIGRMGVAHTIIEVYPGPGWMVEKTLISKYGYLNFYQPKFINTLEPQTAKGIGWQATTKSVRDLWILGTRQINRRSVVIRSPWLLNEMETTEPVKFMTYTSEAQSGFHDDRLRAALLSLWAIHDFSSQVKIETESTIEKNKKATNWQASDLSTDGLKDAWEKRFREILE